jgi:hypothetical protein
MEGADSAWRDESSEPATGSRAYLRYRAFRGLIALGTLGTVLALIVILFYLAF